MANRKRNGGKKKKTSGGMRRIRGRGDYQVSAGGGGNARRGGIFAKLDRALSRIPRGSFAKAGAAVGNRYGGGLGARVGALAGAGVSAITGYGDYKVKMNTLSRMSTSVDMIPQFVKNDHSVRVVHREFIRDLVVPVNGAAFSNTAYTINPANKDIFPWLANIAKQYSQYKIHGMVFAFKTMSSDLALAGPLGTVVMATNYNSVDRDFASKIEMENSEFAVSTKPSTNLIHAIECDPKYSGMDVLYVRDPGYDTADTSDRRFYDYGKWQVATQGLPGAANTTLGELWVSYDIELLKPILGGAATSGISLVSRVDGSVGVGPLSLQVPRPLVVDFAGPLITPLGNTAYNLGPSSADSGMTVVGDTAISGPVVELSGTSLVFKRNGRYTITYVHQYGVTPSKNVVLAVLDAAAAPTMTLYATNRAVATLNTDAVGDIVHAWPTPSAIRRSRFTFNINVTGIVSSTDFITASVSSFTTVGTSLVDTLRRQVQVAWVSYGYNDQTSTFVPV